VVGQRTTALASVARAARPQDLLTTQVHHFIHTSDRASMRDGSVRGVPCIVVADVV